jgi:hypothetical protein
MALTSFAKKNLPASNIHPWTWKPFAASVLLIGFSKAQVVRAMDNFCIMMLCLYMAAFMFACLYAEWLRQALFWTITKALYISEHL